MNKLFIRQYCKYIFANKNLNQKKLRDYFVNLVKTVDHPFLQEENNNAFKRYETPEFIQNYPSVYSNYVQKSKSNGDTLIKNNFLDGNLFLLNKNYSERVFNDYYIHSFLIHYNIRNFKSSREDCSTIPKEYTRLKHGLEEALKNESILTADEIRKNPKIDNFIIDLPNEREINYEGLHVYTKPSKDIKLIHEARNQKCDIIGSTSTISSIIFNLINLQNGFRKLSFPRDSIDYDMMKDYYMSNMIKPTDFRISERDGIMCIDKFDLSPAFTNIFAKMGIILENYFTLDKDNFQDVFVDGKTENYTLENSYKYYKFSERYLLRSQIDCYIEKDGKNIPIEVKTRASAPMRYKNDVYFDYVDYKIDRQWGYAHSWELEYYDLIRGIFPKWAHQLYIGNMDGAFVAYHNTRSLYGVEYITFDKLIDFVYGTRDEYEFHFEIALKSLGQIIDYIKYYHNCKENIVICFNANIPYKLTNNLYVMEIPIEYESRIQKIPEYLFNDAFQLLGYLEQLIGGLPKVVQYNIYLQKFEDEERMGRAFSFNKNKEYTFEYILERYGVVKDRMELVELFYNTYYKHLFYPKMQAKYANIYNDKDKITFP